MSRVLVRLGPPLVAELLIAWLRDQGHEVAPQAAEAAPWNEVDFVIIDGLVETEAGSSIVVNLSEEGMTLSALQGLFTRAP